MLAVIFYVWFLSHDVGTRRDDLVNVELWDGRLIRAGKTSKNSTLTGATGTTIGASTARSATCRPRSANATTTLKQTDR
jgi:hypothetical protein